MNRHKLNRLNKNLKDWKQQEAKAQKGIDYWLITSPKATTLLDSFGSKKREAGNHIVRIEKILSL